MVIAIDTDRAMQALTGVGFKPDQARTLIDQLSPIGDQLATKDFMASEMGKLRIEISHLESGLKEDISSLKVWVVVLMLGQMAAILGLVFAMFQFYLPH